MRVPSGSMQYPTWPAVSSTRSSSPPCSRQYCEAGLATPIAESDVVGDIESLGAEPWEHDAAMIAMSNVRMIVFIDRA